LIAARARHKTSTLADEEAGDAGHAALVPAGGCEFPQARDVGKGDAFVHVAREQQRHIDVDPLADQLLDGGNAFGGGGHFDHDVRTVHRLP